MVDFANPLEQSQLDAASRLYAQLRQWHMTDAALMALAGAFPAWEPEVTLLKVAAVNQLYGTNLYAVNRMAEHVSAIMATADPASEGPALVEYIATLPKLPTQQTQWRHFSFASKLAHFFIDAERFPIYDSYAVQMVGRHLGPKERVRDAAHPYQAYVANLELLRERSGLAWKGRELDLYLWLAGEYRAWLKHPHGPTNKELAQLFAEPQAAADLAALGVG